MSQPLIKEHTREAKEIEEGVINPTEKRKEEEGKRKEGRELSGILLIFKSILRGITGIKAQKINYANRSDS